MQRVLGTDDASSAAIIRGHVSHAGSPVERARVCALREDQFALYGGASCADTDAQGSYELSLARAGAFFVTASAAGFASAFAADGRPIPVRSQTQATEVDITLERNGVRLAGVVLDATGGPVAGAVVRAVREDGQRVGVFHMESAEDGGFELWITPGQVTLYAEADGYAPAMVCAAAPRDGLELMLTPGAALRGRVVSAIDGEPVAGLEVQAQPLDISQFPPAPATSDEQGDFVLEGLTPGGYRLSAEGSEARGELPRPAYVDLGETLEGIEIEVVPAVTVAGEILLRKDGTPCRRGLVTMAPPSGPDESRAEVDRVPSLDAFVINGAFEIQGVPPGRYALRAQCDEHVITEGPTALDVKNEALAGLRWYAEAGLGLLVNVVDGGGRPVPFARVGITGAAPTPEETAPTFVFTADGEGQAKVPTIFQPGVYTVEALDGPVSQLSVELRQGMGEVPVTLRLPGRGALLVQVQTADGVAVDDVEVIASAVPAEAGAPPSRYMAQAMGGGQFRTGPLPEGRYAVRARDDRNPAAVVKTGREASILVGPNLTTSTTIVLERPAELSGRVLDQDGAPRANVWVRATYEGGRERHAAELLSPTTRVLTDPEGTFTLRNLQVGVRYAVHAQDPIGTETVAHDVLPGGGAVTLQLRRPASVRGSVRVAGGAPRADAISVYVTHVDTGRSWVERVVESRFSVENVFAGRVQVLAQSASGSRASELIDVVAGADSEVHLLIEPTPVSASLDSP